MTDINTAWAARMVVEGMSAGDLRKVVWWLAANYRRPHESDFPEICGGYDPDTRKCRYNPGYGACSPEHGVHPDCEACLVAEAVEGVVHDMAPSR